MGIVAQVKRLWPGSEQKLDGNAYLGMMALMGLIGWGATAYVLHFGKVRPPEGVVSLREVGPYIEYVTQYSWTLMGLWAVLVVGMGVIWAVRLERGALLSIPSLVWGIGMAIALIVNAVALQNQMLELVWLPWLVLFTVAYLVTGLLVERGGVYILAGVISGALAANGVFSYATSSGLLIITFDTAVETPLAGSVLFPMPMTYVVIGALHVVPMLIDALRGGRQMTDEGIPKVKAEQQGDDEDDEEVGGVVTT